MAKGQGSIEYLVIIAVVLVIALVVIGVLGWFPALGTATKETESKQYWSGFASPVAITDWKIASTGTTLTLKNMGADRLNVTAITLGGTSIGMTATTLAAGQQTAVTGATVTCATTGTSYQYDVVITYGNLDSGISGNKETGDKPLIGKCVG